MRGPASEEGGGPRSLVGIFKSLVSVFCQGFTSLSEIEVLSLGKFSTLVLLEKINWLKT